jgi:hypothetical protein
MCWNKPTLRQNGLCTPSSSPHGADTSSTQQFPQHSATTPFARPAAELLRRPVTKLQLAHFRANPLSLRGKIFVHVEPASSDAAGSASASRATPAPVDHELFYQITGYLFPAEETKLVVLFAGCRFPEERPAEVIYDLISHSMLVEV